MGGAIVALYSLEYVIRLAPPVNPMRGADFRQAPFTMPEWS